MFRKYRWIKNNLIPHKLSTSCSAYIQSAELTKFNNSWNGKKDLNLYEKFDAIENGIVRETIEEININGKETADWLGEKREDKANTNNFLIKLLMV